MIEAMACGTPVIAFNRGSVPEVISHGVTGYIVDDVTGAVDAVTRLDMLSRTAIRAAFAHRFTARAMAQHYMNIYTALAHPALRQAVVG
jgi:glycosyltransferase involved in cell wall biosynthesis